MVLLVATKSLGFSGRTLYVNFRDSLLKVEDRDLHEEYHLCFVFDEYSVYFDMLYHKFAVEDSDGFHGPYDSIVQAVTIHMFGQIDYIIKFFTEFIVYNKYDMFYEVNYGKFIYNPTDDFFEPGTMPEIRELKKKFKKLGEWEYVKVPKLFIPDDVIPDFIVSLDSIYNYHLFPKYISESKYFTIYRVYENEVMPVNNHLAVNLNKNRAAKVFLPKTLGQGIEWIFDSGKEDLSSYIDSIKTILEVVDATERKIYDNVSSENIDADDVIVLEDVEEVFSGTHIVISNPVSPKLNIVISTINNKIEVIVIDMSGKIFFANNDRISDINTDLATDGKSIAISDTGFYFGSGSPVLEDGVHIVELGQRIFREYHDMPGAWFDENGNEMNIEFTALLLNKEVL